MWIVRRVVAVVFFLATPLVALSGLMASEWSLALMALLLVAAVGLLAGGVGLWRGARWGRASALAAVGLLALPPVGMLVVIGAEVASGGDAGSGWQSLLGLCLGCFALLGLLWKMPAT